MSTTESSPFIEYCNRIKLLTSADGEKFKKIVKLAVDLGPKISPEVIKFLVGSIDHACTETPIKAERLLGLMYLVLELIRGNTEGFAHLFEPSIIKHLHRAIASSPYPFFQKHYSRFPKLFTSIPGCFSKSTLKQLTEMVERFHKTHPALQQQQQPRPTQIQSSILKRPNESTSIYPDPKRPRDERTTPSTHQLPVYPPSLHPPAHPSAHSSQYPPHNYPSSSYPSTYDTHSHHQSYRGGPSNYSNQPSYPPQQSPYQQSHPNQGGGQYTSSQQPYSYPPGSTIDPSLDIDTDSLNYLDGIFTSLQQDNLIPSSLPPASYTSTPYSSTPYSSTSYTSAPYSSTPYPPPSSSGSVPGSGSTSTSSMSSSSASGTYPSSNSTSSSSSSSSSSFTKSGYSVNIIRQALQQMPSIKKVYGAPSVEYLKSDAELEQVDFSLASLSSHSQAQENLPLLYRSDFFHCSSCGLRLPKSVESKHLDGHFREAELSARIHHKSRKWITDINSWKVTEEEHPDYSCDLRYKYLRQLYGLEGDNLTSSTIGGRVPDTESKLTGVDVNTSIDISTSSINADQININKIDINNTYGHGDINTNNDIISGKSDSTDTLQQYGKDSNTGSGDTGIRFPIVLCDEDASNDDAHTAPVCFICTSEFDKTWSEESNSWVYTEAYKLPHKGQHRDHDKFVNSLSMDSRVVLEGMEGHLLHIQCYTNLASVNVPNK